MAALKITLFVTVTAAALGGLFISIDVEAAREKERARIEAVQATTDYQIEYARQLARWKR